MSALGLPDGVWHNVARRTVQLQQALLAGDSLRDVAETLMQSRAAAADGSRHEELLLASRSWRPAKASRLRVDVAPEVACVGRAADCATRRREPAPGGCLKQPDKLPAARSDVSECEQK